ncbi:MAG: multicopper oxidase family protein [Chloroflexota bacterium]
MLNVAKQSSGPESPAPLPGRTLGGVRVYSAALLTLGAALIHLASAPAHLGEFLPFGLFFLGVGSAQIIFAIQLVVRPTRRMALGLAAGSLALVGVWAVSRSVGLPIGPTPGVPESIGLTDVICNAIEVIAVLLLLALAMRPPRLSARRLWLVGLGSLPSAVLTTALTAAAVSATLNGMPDAVNAAPAVAGMQTTSVTTLVEAPGSQPLDSFTLTAASSQVDGQAVWAYNGSVPGPELRVTQGHRVRVTLVNNLPESTTLHWHGVTVLNAADGVAGITQNAVPAGQSYTYEFVAREAGSYWYHSHQQTEQQLERGLFGALIVEPASGRVVQDREYTLMLHGSSGQVSINGVTDNLHLESRPGETVRLRLINAVVPGMDGGPESPILVGAPFQVVALDGRDLNAPDLLGPTRVPLGMGQRADLVFTMPSSGSVRLIDTELTGETSPVQRVLGGSKAPRLASVVLGSGTDSADIDLDLASAPVFDLTRYGSPAVDQVAQARPDVNASIVLDKHPGMREGRPELIHTINGQASPNVLPITVSEGQLVRLHIVNNSEEYHPMHLHGHVLSVVAKNGQPIEGSPVHIDSVLVGPRETLDVAFAADNPGVWMFHCHVLLHASMGMTTTVNYTGVSTPFEMGSTSGNTPE